MAARRGRGIPARRSSVPRSEYRRFHKRFKARGEAPLFSAIGSLKLTRCGVTTPSNGLVTLSSHQNKNPVGVSKRTGQVPLLAVFIERPQADHSNRRYGRKLPLALKVKLPGEGARVSNPPQRRRDYTEKSEIFLCRRGVLRKPDSICNAILYAISVFLCLCGGF